MKTRTVVIAKARIINWIRVETMPPNGTSDFNDSSFGELLPDDDDSIFFANGFLNQKRKITSNAMMV